MIKIIVSETYRVHNPNTLNALKLFSVPQKYLMSEESGFLLDQKCQSSVMASENDVFDAYDDVMLQ